MIDRPMSPYGLGLAIAIEEIAHGVQHPEVVAQAMTIMSPAEFEAFAFGHMAGVALDTELNQMVQS